MLSNSFNHLRAHSATGNYAKIRESGSSPSGCSSIVLGFVVTDRGKMNWHISHRFDPLARPLADRHYNRQKIGSPQFVPPGRCLVLTCVTGSAFWVTSWPFPEYVKHAWPGAWINSAFRRESGPLASELICEAIAATRWFWPDVPALGMVTFIDRGKVRRKRDFGRCYRRAGFRECGETAGGLLALQMLPADMPEPLAPMGTTMEMFTTAASVSGPSE